MGEVAKVKQKKAIMSRSPNTPRPRRANAAYLALASAYPIHPIRSSEDLDDAIAVVDKLLSRRKPLSPQEQDYIDCLSHEIERYESIAYPMPAVSGAAMLKHLIEARAETLSQVAKATKIAVSTLSEVRDNKRNLTLGHIRVLARYFGVEPGVFLD
jgi:antitoxin component HigA of HigAB toxin-antitoxin module